MDKIADKLARIAAETFGVGTVVDVAASLTSSARIDRAYSATIEELTLANATKSIELATLIEQQNTRINQLAQQIGLGIRSIELLNKALLDVVTACRSISDRVDFGPPAGHVDEAVHAALGAACKHHSDSAQFATFTALFRLWDRSVDQQARKTLLERTISRSEEEINGILLIGPGPALITPVGRLKFASQAATNMPVAGTDLLHALDAASFVRRHLSSNRHLVVLTDSAHELLRYWQLAPPAIPKSLKHTLAAIRDLTIVALQDTAQPIKRGRYDVSSIADATQRMQRDALAFRENATAGVSRLLEYADSLYRAEFEMLVAAVREFGGKDVEILETFAQARVPVAPTSTSAACR